MLRVLKRLRIPPAPHRSCTLADVDLLVVEHDAPPALTRPLAAAGATLAVAAPAA